MYCDTPNINEDELVRGDMWILLRLVECALSNKPIMHYHLIMHYEVCQMLPFDWFICVTCAVIFRGSGIMIN